MSKRNKDKGRLPPFVPMFRATIDSPAWRALSTGARSLFLALKAEADNAHYSAYLSTRDARAKVGGSRQKIREWFAELQHYGFIVMLHPGSLGSDGHGKAPLWRITDKGTTRGAYEAPTNDFLRWDGTLFDPKPYRAKRGRTTWEKQNPGHPVHARVVTPYSPVVVTPYMPGSAEGGHPVHAIEGTRGGHPVQSITSLTTRVVSGSTPGLGSKPRAPQIDPRLTTNFMKRGGHGH
jgi:hypothetical protein